jgi:hypothetical protein
MFANSNITKANSANFSFDVPLTIEKDESIIIDLLGDVVSTSDSDIETQQLKSFDIYVQTGSSTFKVESAVITSASFDFVPQNQFTVRIEGQGTKLSRISPVIESAGSFQTGESYIITVVGNTDFTSIGAANNNVDTQFQATGAGSGTGKASYVIPGSAQSESSTRTPLLVYPVVTVDSLNMSSILTLNISLQNNIDWIPFETLHNSLSVTNSSNAMFPSAYTLEKRILSGAIQQYQTDNNITQFDDFSTNSNISLKAIKVGQAAGATPFLQWDINPASYTARMEPGEVYKQTYDYRSLDNTATGTQITQYS